MLLLTNYICHCFYLTLYASHDQSHWFPAYSVYSHSATMLQWSPELEKDLHLSFMSFRPILTPNHPMEFITDNTRNTLATRANLATSLGGFRVCSTKALLTWAQRRDRSRWGCCNRLLRPVQRSPRGVWISWWLCMQSRTLMKTRLVLSPGLTLTLLTRGPSRHQSPSLNCCLARGAKSSVHWLILVSWLNLTLMQ